MARPPSAPALRHCGRAQRSGTGPGPRVFPAEPLPSFQSRKALRSHRLSTGRSRGLALSSSSWFWEHRGAGNKRCSWGLAPHLHIVLPSPYLPCGPQVVVHLTEDLLSRASMTVVNGCPTLTINVSTAREHWLEGMLRHEIGRAASYRHASYPNRLHRHALCSGVFVVVFGKKQ